MSHVVYDEVPPKEPEVDGFELKTRNGKTFGFHQKLSFSYGTVWNFGLTALSDRATTNLPTAAQARQTGHTQLTLDDMESLRDALDKTIRSFRERG